VPTGYLSKNELIEAREQTPCVRVCERSVVCVCVFYLIFCLCVCVCVFVGAFVCVFICVCVCDVCSKNTPQYLT
jgi:hypothetical protein